MILDYWKLREQPFGVTPDPRYLYFSSGHREALASLFYGIETGRGFLSLVAPPGMGKTTLLFQLLRRWKGHVHSAFLFQTQCNSRELMRYLLADLGLKTDGEDIVRMHSELNEFLFRESKAGRRVVVFIDEAQNLSAPVLETVRLLSNFEAPESKLMQIVLTGQPELAQRLAQPELSQLRQRIAVQTRLEPLSPAEVARYVKHRLQVAGHQGANLFDSAALDLVASYSGGIPRLINVLCFDSLSLGFAGRHSQVTPDIIREAARDLGFNKPEPARKVRPEKTLEMAAQVPSRWRFFYASIRKMARRPLAQVAALCLVLGIEAFRLAEHSDGVSALVSRTNMHVSHPSSTPSAVVPAPAVSVGPVRPDEASSDFVVSYVAQPHDTIDSVCLLVFKQCDESALNEIRRLNPNLKNLNLLEVGQQIRLPRRPEKPVTSKAALP